MDKPDEIRVFFRDPLTGGLKEIASDPEAAASWQSEYKTLPDDDDPWWVTPLG